MDEEGQKYKLTFRQLYGCDAKSSAQVPPCTDYEYSCQADGCDAHTPDVSLHCQIMNIYEMKVRVQGSKPSLWKWSPQTLLKM